MRKIFTFLLIFIFSASALNAQLGYNFTAAPGTYTPVAGGTIPNLITPDVNNYFTHDEGFANGIPIGFTFIYNGTPYENININVNGFISLGEGFQEDPNENYFYDTLRDGPLSQPGARPLIAPMWADLDFNADDSITYLLTGVAPNRVLTVQWANAYWDYRATNPSISFQVKLYETTNVIEFVYRKEAGTPTSVSSIGLTGAGAGAGNFMSLSNSSASPGISTTQDWYINTSPATNQVYRFTPLACVAPTVTQLSHVTPTSVTFSWSPVTGATGYEYAFADSATPPASGTSALTDSVNISGLTAGVNNYLFVRTACGGGSFSSWSTKTFVPCTTNILPANGDTVSKPPVISWNPVAGATGYSVMLSTDGIDYVNLGTVPDSVTTTQITNTAHDSTYYFYVRPVVGSDTSSTTCQSNATSFTIGAMPVIPCTTNTFPANGATGVDVPTLVSFNKVEGAGAYAIMLSLNDTDFTNLGSISDTSVLLPPLDFGSTYYFYVRPIIGEDTASTTCSVNATSFTTHNPPPVPPNDSCGAAINITPADGVVNGTTFSATHTPVGGICPEPFGTDPSNPDDDVWYKYTPPATGTGTITVTGGPYFDAVLSVYTGNCDSLTLLDCADNTFDEEAETLTLKNLQAGETYYIRVYDYYTARPGTFTISVSGDTLPSVMGELRGKSMGSGNVLTCITQIKPGNKGFEVQRSADGEEFYTIDFVPSKSPGGNKASAELYNYVDVNPLGGSSFYRFKAAGGGGKFAYSNIVVLKGTGVTQLQLSNLYPNPSKSVLNMEIASPLNNKINLVITDLAGKIVLKQSARLISGNNSLKINIEKLSSGSYLIKAICADGCRTAVRKFVKQ